MTFDYCALYKYSYILTYYIIRIYVTIKCTFVRQIIIGFCCHLHKKGVIDVLVEFFVNKTVFHDLEYLVVFADINLSLY